MQPVSLMNVARIKLAPDGVNCRSLTSTDELSSSMGEKRFLDYLSYFNFIKENLVDFSN
jgi:hypothetical protein